MMLTDITIWHHALLNIEENQQTSFGTRAYTTQLKTKLVLEEAEYSIQYHNCCTNQAGIMIHRFTDNVYSKWRLNKVMFRICTVITWNAGMSFHFTLCKNSIVCPCTRLIEHKFTRHSIVHDSFKHLCNHCFTGILYNLIVEYWNHIKDDRSAFLFASEHLYWTLTLHVSCNIPKHLCKDVPGFV